MMARRPSSNTITAAVVLHFSSIWFTWTVGIGLMVLLAALIFVAWWGLFADRPRGRRRCPRCWYDMTHVPGLTCSECGQVARSEAALARTRQHWPVALLAMFGCAAIGGFVIDRANMRGWMSYMPTPGLIMLMPMVGNSQNSVFFELDRRLQDKKLGDRQMLAMIRRCAKGDGEAKPPSDEWIAKYGRVAPRWINHLLGAADEPLREEAERVLFAIPPRIDFSTRPTWPVGVPPTLDVTARDWWPRDTHVRIEATPRLRGATTDVHIRRDGPIQPRSYSLILPALDEGRHRVEVEMAFYRRSDAEEEWTQVGTRVLATEVEVAGTLDETLTPVAGETLDAALERTFSTGLVKWGRGSLPVRVGSDARYTYTEDFAGTGVAVRIDVLRNDVLARQLDMWWVAGPDVAERQRAWEVPFWDDALLGAPDVEDDRWRVRVRGLPELALRLEGVDKYWSGEIEVPVPVQTRRGRAPRRGWILWGSDEATERRSEEEAAAGSR